MCSVDLCCFLGSTYRPPRNSTVFPYPNFNSGKIRLKGMSRGTLTGRCLTYCSRRVQRRGVVIPFTLLWWALSPSPAPRSCHASLCILTSIAATANATFKSPLQGCFNLQHHLAFGKLLCRERTEESLTEWKRVGLCRHLGGARAGKRGDLGDSKR